MVSWPRKLRTIRRSQLFELSVNHITSVERLDEVLEGVEWALANDPDRFDQVPGTALRIVLTDPFPDIPPLRIYFTIDDADYVSLQWAEPTDYEVEEEDST